MSTYPTNNTLWYYRTDGKPICENCISFNTYNKKCSINKNESSSEYPFSCDSYQKVRGGDRD